MKIFLSLSLCIQIMLISQLFLPVVHVSSHFLRCVQKEVEVFRERQACILNKQDVQVKGKGYSYITKKVFVMQVCYT
jgi:hypothetical protein